MFLLDDRMIGIRTSHQRIRIQKAKKRTDPDPQHCKNLDLDPDPKSPEGPASGSGLNKY
jgi:hypothetical protein